MVWWIGLVILVLLAAQSSWQLFWRTLMKQVQHGKPAF
jgi:hypothetical protein